MLSGQIDALVDLINKLTTNEQVDAAMELVQKLHESDRVRAWNACQEALKRV